MTTSSTLLLLAAVAVGLLARPVAAAGSCYSCTKDTKTECNACSSYDNCMWSTVDNKCKERSCTSCSTKSQTACNSCANCAWDTSDNKCEDFDLSGAAAAIGGFLIFIIILAVVCPLCIIGACIYCFCCAGAAAAKAAQSPSPTVVVGAPAYQNMHGQM